MWSPHDATGAGKRVKPCRCHCWKGVRKGHPLVWPFVLWTARGPRAAGGGAPTAPRSRTSCPARSQSNEASRRAAGLGTPAACATRAESHRRIGYFFSAALICTNPTPSASRPVKPRDWHVDPLRFRRAAPAPCAVQGGPGTTAALRPPLAAKRPPSGPKFRPGIPVDTPHPARLASPHARQAEKPIPLDPRSA